MAAIDPSLSSAAVWVGSDLYDRTGGVFAADKAVDGVAARMTRWRNHGDAIVDAACRSRFGPPALVVVEGYSFGSKGAGSIDLGEFGAILRTKLLDVARRVIEVPPAVVKKFATGVGNATKEKVAAALGAKYGWIYDKSDQYDALALWLIAHAYLVGEASPLVKSKLLTLSQIATAKGIK